MPHVRIDGAVYFVTWRVRLGQSDLSEDERDCVATAIRHFDTARYILHAYVVMNDHVHVLMQPLLDCQIEEILQSWKSFTTNQMQRQHGRQGSIWQDEYFDRVVRDDGEYEQKRDYIVHNPRKRWPHIESYPWQWAIGTDRSIPR
ncbi:MAG: transposase [Aliidongia sp.]